MFQLDNNSKKKAYKLKYFKFIISVNSINIWLFLMTFGICTSSDEVLKCLFLNAICKVIADHRKCRRGHHKIRRSERFMFKTYSRTVWRAAQQISKPSVLRIAFHQNQWGCQNFQAPWQKVCYNGTKDISHNQGGTKYGFGFVVQKSWILHFC